MSERAILVADDDETHVEWVRRAIDRSGIPCRLDVVREGAEALRHQPRNL